MSRLTPQPTVFHRKSRLEAASEQRVAAPLLRVSTPISNLRTPN